MTQPKKVKVPEPRPNCPMHKQIEKQILYHQRNLQYLNDGMLEQFWAMNIEQKETANTTTTS